MARDDRGGDRGKVKVRVIDFEMEGSNQTLRDGIRDIVTAIGRGATVVRVTQPAALAERKRSESQDKNTLQDEAVDTFEGEVGESDDENVEEVAASKPRRNRRVKPLKVVQIDLVGGDVPLKDFLGVAPDALEKRYLLIAYWFKKYRQLDAINPDHIYTAYMAMGWTTMPRDASKPFRHAKADGLFEKAEGDSTYSINHIGEMKAMEIIHKP